MDGNGRWADQRGLPRVAGHRAGAEAVRKTLRAAAECGVETLTLYAFSSENWRRPEGEIADLKGLLGYYLERELNSLAKEGVRLKLIGDYAAFGPDLVAAPRQGGGAAGREQPADPGRGAQLRLARPRLPTRPARLPARPRPGISTPTASTRTRLRAELQTAGLPELDLLIRTSGEVRLSNFLLWQAAYAEMLFTPVLWPDFDEAAFKAAVAEFAARQRRFGGR